MKPGDHPEFFLRPPPPGRSRESTIRLDRQGRFWHDGRLVEHAGMARSFASWVDRHPLDGRYVLNNGYDWSYFEVEDAPFHVRAFHAEPTPEIELTDGSREPLDPEGLWVGEGDALYCRVRGGRFFARFSPGAQLALAPYLEETAVGEPALRLGERLFPIASTPVGVEAR